MIGRRLSHYEIKEEISRGGMGVVYRAVDVRLGREVALKVLPDDLVHDAARRERLVQEARAASHLEHPHIAVIHDVDEDDGVTFIAMELIRGEKLSDVLARGPLPLKRALDLAVEIAEGLARAHEKAVIHRDVKPANVMVTAEGHAKIIDFGLAKQNEPVAHEAATATLARPATEPGLILGTAAYMSPEQARGVRVDHRTDVFSLGVTLFEMLTSRLPFQGASSLDTMHAILTQPTPILPAMAGLPEMAVAHVQRVIEKCTAKDPDERYQGMRDLVVDLRAARRVLDSAAGTTTSGSTMVRPPIAPAARRVPLGLVAALGLVVAIAAAALWWWPRDPATVPPSGKPAVAVMYFENNTGDPSLEWMRTGLTDMLVTDLSQATEFEVLGTDRLLQILQELRRADDRVIAADVVQEVATRAAVDTVLVGSYVKAGETIRINARLQNARTGRIVTAERVEGAGPASVFSLVDELTRKLKASLTSMSSTPSSLIKKPGAPDDTAGLDRSLSEVTTESIEAYRHYAEAMDYHYRGLYAQAIPPFERAIDIDPRFAMALAKLAVVHSNLGHPDERDTYAKRALALIDRLTPRERYYIEGFYYTLRPETLARGIEAYRQGLALHPEQMASRHNLALKYQQLERYKEAIEQNEELVRRGIGTISTHSNLAASYLGDGDPGRALAIAEDVVRRHPTSALAYQTHGLYLISAGRYSEARQAMEKSLSINPRSFVPRLGLLSAALAERRWSDLEREIAALRQSDDPFQRMLGAGVSADLALIRGRGQSALAQFEQITQASIAPTDRAAYRGRIAAILVRMGRPGEAVVQAEGAVAEGRGTESEFETLETLAIAQAAARRFADAEKTIALLESRASILPSPRETRRVLVARGELARARGDKATALAELRKAESMLPPYGPPLGPASTHAQVWLASGMAAIDAGEDAAAARTLERLQGGHERVFDLDAWTRSFFLLGRIYERQGQRDKAREQFSAFLDLRRDGDMDREWIAEAEKKVK